MNKIYFIITLILLIGCSDANQDYLKSNSTITAVFNKSEIRDLTKILNFFNEQTCTIQEVDKSNLAYCYQSYIKRISKTALETGSVEIKIPFEAQQKMYNRISDSTLNQIWTFGRALHLHHPERNFFNETEIKLNGKYMDFLEELGKDYELIDNYHNDVAVAGGLSPTVVASLLNNYDAYNIEDIRIRLVIAIHYLTMNDQFERRENY